MATEMFYLKQRAIINIQQTDYIETPAEKREGTESPHS